MLKDLIVVFLVFESVFSVGALGFSVIATGQVSFESFFPAWCIFTALAFSIPLLISLSILLNKNEVLEEIA